MVKGNSSIGEIRKKVTKTHELISASHHESGHVIYGLLHLMKVISVEVFENQKYKRVHGVAYSEYPYPYNYESIEDPYIENRFIMADIGMNYAGLIAEKTLFKNISGSRQIPMFIIDGSTDDNKNAYVIIKKYNLAPPGPKRAALKRKIIREVQEEINHHWEEVTIVAHALFKFRKLTYQDLQKLLTKKSKNKKFWKEQFKNINYIHDNNEHIDIKDLRIIL
jgi:hypothetical protein